MKIKRNKALIFANFVLGSAVIILILAIFYLSYKSGSLQAALSRKIVLILISGLIFSIIALFLRENIKINIVITLLSIMVSAYSVELGLFYYYNDPLPQTKKVTRSKLDVIEDLRSKGVDAWPVIMPFEFIESNGLLSSQDRLFPLGGISNKTIVFCEEGGPFVVYENDEHGFNNPKGLYENIDIKIALIGDSYVQGACVQAGEDITSRIRNMGIGALNLGNASNGPLIELATFKEYVEPIRPKIVLWVYYEGNDLDGLNNERKSLILMNYLEDNYSQNLLERQKEIDSALIPYVNEKKNDHKVQVTVIRKDTENILRIIKLRNLRDRLELITQTQTPEEITKYESSLFLLSKILDTTNRKVTGWGGKLYFVYIHSFERYVKKRPDSNAYNRNDVLNAVRKLGIPMIDIYEALEKDPDRLSLYPFTDMSSPLCNMPHFNADGYKFIAEVIADRLRKDGLISDM
jgi:hypothetical protein